jgi:heptosyltransferase-1
MKPRWRSEIPSRVLLVRLRQIGDVVFTTPAVRAVKRQFPTAHLTYVVEPAAAPIVSANPHIDELIVAPRQRGPAGVAADLALGRRLRRSGFDVAIDFHGGPRSSLLTWLSRAPVRIGYDVAGRGWMYTQRVARPRALRPRHSVENQWDLLAPLGVAPPDPARDPVEMPVERGAARAVADRLASAGIRDEHRLIVVHVSAGNPFRRWPQSHFVGLVHRLVAADPERRLILTSGPSEHEAAAAVGTAARAILGKPAARHVVECGEFSLAELRALVEGAALFIGGDSGPLHVASTSRVPIVGLYGPTLAARSRPWRASAYPSAALEVEGLPCRPCEQRRCEPGDFRCLVRIAADEVVAAAESLLSAKMV